MKIVMKCKETKEKWWENVEKRMEMTQREKWMWHQHPVHSSCTVSSTTRLIQFFSTHFIFIPFYFLALLLFSTLLILFISIFASKPNFLFFPYRYKWFSLVVQIIYAHKHRTMTTSILVENFKNLFKIKWLFENYREFFFLYLTEFFPKFSCIFPSCIHFCPFPSHSPTLRLYHQRINKIVIYGPKIDFGKKTH